MVEQKLNLHISGAGRISETKVAQMDHDERLIGHCGTGDNCYLLCLVRLLLLSNE